jgi:hypothetical protein
MLLIILSLSFNNVDSIPLTKEIEQKNNKKTTKTTTTKNRNKQHKIVNKTYLHRCVFMTLYL